MIAKNLRVECCISCMVLESVLAKYIDDIFKNDHPTGLRKGHLHYFINFFHTTYNVVPTAYLP